MPVYSFLRYPGSKRRVYPYLDSKFPDDIEEWCEPFLGSAAVTLGFLQSSKSKNCKKIVVGDLYSEVYNFWLAVQQCPNEVIALVREWMHEKCPLKERFGFIDSAHSAGKEQYEQFKASEELRQEAQALWAWIMSVDCEKLTLAERGARFALSNRTSFSAMSDSGSLSVDRYLDFKVDDIEKILPLHELFKNVEIYNKSFTETMPMVNPKTGFIFLDPPYLKQEESALYGRGGSTHKGFPHRELAELCAEIKTRWLMTYDDSVGVRQLYKTSHITPFQFNYTMAKQASEDALAGEEVLVSNYYSEESEEVDLDDF